MGQRTALPHTPLVSGTLAWAHADAIRREHAGSHAPRPLTHSAVSAFVLDADLLSLGVISATQDLDDGLLVRAQTLHGFPQGMGVRGRVKARRRPDGSLELVTGQVRTGQIGS